MKKFAALIVMAVAFLCMVAAVAQAGWKYNDGDLWGSGCIQSRIDTLESGTISDAVRKAVVGPDNTSILAVIQGTCTNGQTVVFGTAFAATPIVLVQQVDSTNVCYATSTTPSNFAAVVYGTSTQKWIAVGTK